MSPTAKSLASVLVSTAFLLCGRHLNAQHAATPPPTRAAFATVAVDEAEVRSVLAAGLDSALTIPWPGGTLSVEVTEASVFPTGMQARYPALRSYRVRAVDGRFVGRISAGPRGLRVVGQSAGRGTVAFEPVEELAGAPAVATSSPRRYRLRRLDYALPAGVCGVDDPPELTDASGGRATAKPLARTGETMRVYRLALACTGEFAAEAGGTLAAVNERYNEYLSEVNALYERDLAVTFRLADGNDALIQLDASDDVYPAPSDARAGLDLTQDFIEATLESRDYDLGHALHYDEMIQGVGGIAYTTGVCNARFKAGGYSRVNEDLFRIFLHELGHQLGGRHTSYGCSSSGPYRYEPGAGATIMSTDANCTFADRGYRFIDGVGFEDYVAAFHAGTIADMNAHISGDGACFDAEATGNAAPVADANAARGSLAIPARTPFVLRGGGTDANGDGLSYSWESGDTDEDNSDIPTAAAGIATAPLFRTLEPAASPDRFLPSLSNLAGPLTDDRWGEVLPTVSREMRMTLTVRDGRGGVDVDAVTLDVIDTGRPFAVTAPTAGTAWVVTEEATVTWDVAGTDGNGIGCQAVDILLSTDGGLTFPTVLAADVPNTGSATVRPPDLLTSRARVMVRAADHAFFNVTREDFSLIGERACVTRVLGFDAGETVRAPAGDARLQLGLSVATGGSLRGPLRYTVEDGAATRGQLWTGITDGGCGLLNFGVADGVRTVGQRFTVAEDVDVTFELMEVESGSVGAASSLLYESDGTPGACDGFLNSTGSYTLDGSGNVSYAFASFTERLSAGRSYELFVQSFSTGPVSGLVSIDYSPSEVLLESGDGVAAGYAYSFVVAREIAEDIYLVADFAEGGDLSDASRFPAGTYVVAGVHAPEGTDLAAAVGQDLRVLPEYIRCATVSEERQRVVIEGSSPVGEWARATVATVVPNPSGAAEVELRIGSRVGAGARTLRVADALGRTISETSAGPVIARGAQSAYRLALPAAQGVYHVAALGADGRVLARARALRQ